MRSATAVARRTRTQGSLSVPAGLGRAITARGPHGRLAILQAQEVRQGRAGECDRVRAWGLRLAMHGAEDLSGTKIGKHDLSRATDPQEIDMTAPQKAPGDEGDWSGEIRAAFAAHRRPPPRLRQFGLFARCPHIVNSPSTARTGPGRMEAARAEGEPDGGGPGGVGGWERPGPGWSGWEPDRAVSARVGTGSGGGRAGWRRLGRGRGGWERARMGPDRAVSARACFGSPSGGVQ